MAIHGAGHVNYRYFSGYQGVPTLATVLHDRYGDALQTFDMRQYAILIDNVLPFDNFPMYVEVGHVFVVGSHFADGEVTRMYFRAG